MKHIYKMFFTSILIGLLVLFTTMPASAIWTNIQYETDDGIGYIITGEPGKYYAKVNQLSGDALVGDLVIPETIEGYPVKIVRLSDVYEKHQITGISFPKNMESFQGGFYRCSGINKITVAKGNSTYYSENDCLIDKTKNAIVLASNTSIIPDGIKIVGGFSGRTMSQINIPASVKEIENSAFSNCPNLSVVNLPMGLETIRGCAFGGCEKLETITIPDSVTKFEHDIFNSCHVLKEVKGGNGIKKIYSGTFSGCTSLTSLKLGNSVEEIEFSAFLDCTNLKSFTSNKVLKKIEDGAFRNCTSLETVTLGLGIKEIGQGAFSNCPNLKTVHYEGTYGNWIGIKIWLSNEALENAQIVYNADISPNPTMTPMPTPKVTPKVTPKPTVKPTEQPTATATSTAILTPPPKTDAVTSSAEQSATATVQTTPDANIDNKTNTNKIPLIIIIGTVVISAGVIIAIIVRKNKTQ